VNAFNPRGVHPHFQQAVIGDEKGRAAVHSAGETDTNRRVRRQAGEPALDFVSQRADVVFAELLEVRGEGVSRGREKTLIDRIRVWATDQMDLHDVMRGHHARVVRMKLVAKAFVLEPIPNRINAMGDDECWSFVALGQEVAQGPVQRTGHAHDFPVLGHKREGAFNLAYGFGPAVQKAGTGFLRGQVEDVITVEFGQINDPFEVLVHSAFGF
jgi:hypothetical protein